MLPLSDPEAQPSDNRQSGSFTQLSARFPHHRLAEVPFGWLWLTGLDTVKKKRVRERMERAIGLEISRLESFADLSNLLSDAFLGVQPTPSIPLLRRAELHKPMNREYSDKQPGK